MSLCLHDRCNTWKRHLRQYKDIRSQILNCRSFFIKAKWKIIFIQWGQLEYFICEFDIVLNIAQARPKLEGCDPHSRSVDTRSTGLFDSVFGCGCGSVCCWFCCWLLIWAMDHCVRLEDLISPKLWCPEAPRIGERSLNYARCKIREMHQPIFWASMSVVMNFPRWRCWICRLLYGRGTQTLPQHQSLKNVDKCNSRTCSQDQNLSRVATYTWSSTVYVWWEW